MVWKWPLRALLSVILCGSGCSQSFWRKQADKDSYQVWNQLESDPRWVNPRKNLMPDPRSRFFDPYDPDREPLTPDDPAAAAIMDCPGGIPGYKSWHKLGRSFSVENPGWLEQFQIAPEMMDEETGEYTEPVPTIPDLTILDAVELTYLHDRDYQSQLEQTYLAALALTFERFRFQVRFLGIGGGEPGSSLRYENVPGLQDSLGMNNRFGVSQLLPTGGQWAAELANNTLWIFSGPNAGTSSASLLSYRLVQPLLLGAGRKIALENLTQTERDLLYSVRDLSRFRKILFTQTVSGGAGGGYLGMLTQMQAIRNQQYNIAQLERQVRELRANVAVPPGTTESPLVKLPAGLVIPEALADKMNHDEERGLLQWFGMMSQEQADLLVGLSDDAAWQAASRELTQLLRNDVVPLDVAQLESRLASAIIQLRSSELRFKDTLDSYKIQLGLPPDVHMTIDDEGLQQFELIDPVLEQLQAEAEAFVERTGLLNAEQPDLELTAQVLAESRLLHKKILEKGNALVAEDVRRVNENLEKRLSGVSSEADRERIIKTVERDRDQFAALTAGIRAIAQELEMVEELLDRAASDAEALKQAVPLLQSIRENLVMRVQGLQVVQVGLRSEMITVNRFQFSLEDSVGLALENRLDLMNARAEVVDARRQEEVAANRLKAVLDVVVEGDIRNEPGSSKPFNFSGTSSSHRVGVQFTAPLDQVAERNVYRAAQINYQRSRREYMEFEDGVKLSIRTAWRNLQILEQNLETARQALRINVIQYDQAVEESNAPGAPNQGGVRGRNLVDALNSILDAQNRLVQIWADYERTRLEIFRDMDIMEIDPDGVWIDPYYQNLKLKAHAQHENQDFVPLPPEPTAGDFEVHLLPPGPAGVTHVNDRNESHQTVSSPGRFNEPSPVPPAQRAPEETAFIADPLGWKPGNPPRRLDHGGPVLGPDTSREQRGNVDAAEHDARGTSPLDLVPAPGPADP
ncbi:MAG: TolC family protein [Planctomycetaceae bacterium]